MTFKGNSRSSTTADVIRTSVADPEIFDEYATCTTEKCRWIDAFPPLPWIRPCYHFVASCMGHRVTACFMGKNVPVTASNLE